MPSLPARVRPVSAWPIRAGHVLSPCMGEAPRLELSRMTHFRGATTLGPAAAVGAVPHCLRASCSGFCATHAPAAFTLHMPQLPHICWNNPSLACRPSVLAGNPLASIDGDCVRDREIVDHQRLTWHASRLSLQATRSRQSAASARGSVRLWTTSACRAWATASARRCRRSWRRPRPARWACWRGTPPPCCPRWQGTPRCCAGSSPTCRVGICINIPSIQPQAAGTDVIFLLSYMQMLGNVQCMSSEALVLWLSCITCWPQSV